MGVSAALSVMAGLPNPELTSHWQVNNAVIENNLLINCRQSFCIGAGKNAERYLKAENTVFRNNIISTPYQALHWVDDSVQVNFSGNRVWEALDRDKLPAGFSLEDPLLKTGASGIMVLPSSAKKPPFWMVEATGPAWRKEGFRFTAREDK
jgi:poly(beta-D-mannuronate) lyase